MGLIELDTSLFFFINKNLQNGFFDLAMPFVSKHAKMLFLFIVIWTMKEEKKLSWGPLFIALCAIALADGSGHIAKDSIGRERPCTILQDVNLLVGCGHSYSLPSNHASNAFAFAMTFFFLRRNMVSYVAVAVAALVAFSRVSVGVHYPFDVLVGALLGTGAAYAAIQLYRWGTRIYEKKAYGEFLGFSLLLISLFRIYFIFTGPFDLSPDEAHYWEWSRRPDWSYYSKGPMIAYLIYLGTALFGDTVFGVRIFAVLLSAAGSFLLYRTARDLYGERTALVSALLIQIVPLYAVYGLLFTIDSPFLFFWVLSLYLFRGVLRRRLHEHKGKPLDYYWVLLGLSVGLGLLTKYTMAFFPVSGVLFLISSKSRRDLLRIPGPYVAGVVSLMVFSPVIFWNAANGWVTLKHTAGQAHVSEGLQISARSFLEFIGSQIGVITPVLFLLFFTALWKLRKSEEGAFLIWFSVPTLLFFALKSLQGKVQANWALPGYATAFIAFSACYVKDRMQSKNRTTVLIGAGILLSLLVTFFAHVPSVLRLPQKQDPTARLVGWKELGHEATMAYRELSSSGPVFIFSDKYQVSSELAFYMEGHPQTYCVNLGRRMNQYDLWPGFDRLVGYHALFVRTSDAHLPEEVKKAFSSCEKQLVPVETKQKKIMKFTLFKCYDFKGMTMKQTDSY